MMRYQGAALALEKPQGLSCLGVKLFKYLEMKIRYGNVKNSVRNLPSIEVHSR